MTRNIWTLISAALVVSAAIAGQASATTVILDTFTRTGPLLGSSPLDSSPPGIDTTAEAHTWGDSPDFNTNGSVMTTPTSGNTVALLPFQLSDVPAFALITLSADPEVVDTSAKEDWVGFGFLAGGSALGGTGAPWALLAANGETAAFAGPGAINVFASTAGGAGDDSTANLALTYNNISKVASFYVNGVFQGSTTYGSAPGITDVAVQLLSFDVTGTVDNLTVSYELIPEPASLGMLLLGGALLLRRRRA